MSIFSKLLGSLGKKLLGKKFSWIIPVATLFFRRKSLKSKRRKATPPKPDYSNVVAIMSYIPSLRSALPMPTVGLTRVTSGIEKVNPAFNVAMANQLVKRTPLLNLFNIRNALNLYDTLHDVITKSFLREAEAKGQGMVAYHKYKNLINDWTAQALMGWWYWNKNRQSPTGNPLLDMYVHSDFGNPNKNTYYFFAPYDVMRKALGWW